jgi:hypothetical protein
MSGGIDNCFEDWSGGKSPYDKRSYLIIGFLLQRFFEKKFTQKLFRIYLKAVSENTGSWTGKMLEKFRFYGFRHLLKLAIGEVESEMGRGLVLKEFLFAAERVDGFIRQSEFNKVNPNSPKGKI